MNEKVIDRMIDLITEHIIEDGYEVSSGHGQFTTYVDHDTMLKVNDLMCSVYVVPREMREEVFGGVMDKLMENYIENN
jgi:hypothetical protein